MLTDALRNLYYRSPGSLQRAILIRRRQAEWTRAGVVFVHVPKAAGTSISEALYGRFLGHIRASDVERWASREVKALPRFAIVRNPWDRAVSAYRFAMQRGGERIAEFETFETFVTHWLAPRDLSTLNGVYQPQAQFVCDAHGRVLVDHVGRFESLEPTVAHLRQLQPNVGPIGHANRSGKAIDYRSFYTPELADLIASIYARDVALFGYAFGD